MDEATFDRSTLGDVQKGSYSLFRVLQWISFIYEYHYLFLYHIEEHGNLWDRHNSNSLVRGYSLSFCLSVLAKYRCLCTQPLLRNCDNTCFIHIAQQFALHCDFLFAANSSNTQAFLRLTFLCDIF